MTETIDPRGLTLISPEAFGDMEAWHATIAELRGRGALVVHEPAPTEWGGYSSYIEDPDGHRWEIAHNPFWPLDEDGRVRLPAGDS